MLSSKILDAMQFVRNYVGDTDSWIIVKKELLRALPPAERTGFSTRDGKTKRQSINAFEEKIIGIWEEMTGVRLGLK